jgi:Ig-like domain from next to BRCA1 gene
MQTPKAIGTIVFALTLSAASCGGSGSEGQRKPGNVKEAEKIVAEDRASGPMPEGAFKAVITVPDPPAKLRPGQKLTINVRVKNIGNAPWPSHGRASDGFFQVNLGNMWYDSKNSRIEKNPYIRSGLPSNVRPGEEVEVPLSITAPSAPGEYTLQIDLVQEMVSWFAEKGSSAPKFKVNVGG